MFTRLCFYLLLLCAVCNGTKPNLKQHVNQHALENGIKGVQDDYTVDIALFWVRPQAQILDYGGVWNTVDIHLSKMGVIVDFFSEDWPVQSQIRIGVNTFNYNLIRPIQDYVRQDFEECIVLNGYKAEFGFNTFDTWIKQSYECLDDECKPNFDSLDWHFECTSIAHCNDVPSGKYIPLWNPDDCAFQTAYSLQNQLMLLTDVQVWHCWQDLMFSPNKPCQEFV